MPTTWLEVIDTAVKVGLGAAVSGVASFAMARRTHGYSLKKAAFDNAAALLKEGALRLEDSSSALNSAIHKYDLFVRGSTTANEALDHTLEAHNFGKNAKALFYLINATDLAKLVSPYLETIEKIRDVIDNESKETAPEKEALDKCVEDVLKHRQGILEALGPAYKEVQTRS